MCISYIMTIMLNIAEWDAKSGFEQTHSISGLDGKRLESSPSCSEVPWTADKSRSCARNRFVMICTCKVTSRFWTSVQKISSILFAKRLNESTWATTHDSWLIVQILQEREVLADAVSSIFHVSVETSWTDNVHCQLWNWIGSHEHGSFVVVSEIQTWLEWQPGSLLISRCGTTTETCLFASEFTGSRLS